MIIRVNCACIEAVVHLRVNGVINDVQIPILEGKRHGVTLRAKAFCDMLFLSRDDLYEAMDFLPAFKFDLVRQAIPLFGCAFRLCCIL